MKKSDNETILNPSVEQNGSAVRSIHIARRTGTYSGVGYQKLEGPQSQDERWNMPFMDPEFEYDSNNADFH